MFEAATNVTIGLILYNLHRVDLAALFINGCAIDGVVAIACYVSEGRSLSRFPATHNSDLGIFFDAALTI